MLGIGLACGLYILKKYIYSTYTLYKYYIDVCVCIHYKVYILYLYLKSIAMKDYSLDNIA